MLGCYCEFEANIKLRKDANLLDLKKKMENTFFVNPDWCLKFKEDGLYLDCCEFGYDVEESDLLKIQEFCESGYVKFINTDEYKHWMCYLDNGVWKRAEGSITYDTIKAVDLHDIYNR